MIYLIGSRAMNQKDLYLDEIGKKCEVGDWKLLYLLAKNMEPLVFGEFLRELYHTMKKKDPKDENNSLRMTPHANLKLMANDVVDLPEGSLNGKSYAV